MIASAYELLVYYSFLHLFVLTLVLVVYIQFVISIGLHICVVLGRVEGLDNVYVLFW